MPPVAASARPLALPRSLALALALALGPIACGDDTSPASAGASETEASSGSGDATGSTGSGGEASSGGETSGVGDTTGDPGPTYDGEPLPPGEPGEWVWVDFPDAFCRDGTPTGIAVRYGTSANLMIYLQGGGACWNTLTCFNNPGFYGAPEFAEWVDPWGSIGIFNDESPDNPVGEWSVVYLPYCSGDVFAGGREGVMIDEQPDPMDFVGYRNIGAFLQRIVPTFADAPAVLIAGASAGGFGGGFNFIRFAKAFPKSEITFIDDSAPILADEYTAPCLQQTWRDTWGLTENLPPGCDACTGPDGGGLTNLAAHIAAAVPRANLGLISSTRDATISIFYAFGVDDCSGVGTMPGSVFQEGLFRYRDEELAPSGWGSYFIASNEHVWTQLNSDFFETDVAGVLLTDWVQDLLDGQASHVAP
ncbi:MAG: hypothetical protein H6710_02555 [Myxococcales bacterium]|nr:hypothetical protein [Myxococcales bacterium]MCB9703949.1 hypothetical protein [Myxococcales bacterium]